jgi:hypothetical protein
MNLTFGSLYPQFCLEHSPHVLTSQNAQGGGVVPHSIGGPTRESMMMELDKRNEPSHFESLSVCNG